MLAQYYSLSGSVEYYIILYMKWIMNTIVDLCEKYVIMYEIGMCRYTVAYISCILYTVYVAIKYDWAVRIVECNIIQAMYNTIVILLLRVVI